MQTRTPRAFVAAAALALFASACTDTPTAAPAARAPGERASLNASGSGPTLIPNSVKYRDTGGKPVKGRSGSAELETMAVLDKQGVTTVSYYARHATEWWRNGNISRLQLKAAAPDGQHKFTRNMPVADLDPWGYPTSSGELQLRGLGGGDQLQMQAHVTGLDPHRTDVVAVTQKVKRLPDMTVSITAPAEVETNSYVTVLAVVNERNGDLGAHASCVLYADGNPVDFALGVWVDAGDAVTCAMSMVFTAPGTFPLEVRVHNWGREWDASNNADTATIQVNGESPRFYTSASFSQLNTVDTTIVHDSWRDSRFGIEGEYREERFVIQKDQSATLYGLMPARMNGPFDARFSMSTGGRIVDTSVLSGVELGDGYYACRGIWKGPTHVGVCAWGGAVVGTTSVAYSFVAGAVTYHSELFSRQWDSNTGTEDVYHWNGDYAFDETVPLGDDWTFDVRLSTPGGEHDLSRTLQLTRSGPSGYSNPYACYRWDDASWGYSQTYCSQFTSYREYIFG